MLGRTGSDHVTYDPYVDRVPRRAKNELETMLWLYMKLLLRHRKTLICFSVVPIVSLLLILLTRCFDYHYKMTVSYENFDACPDNYTWWQEEIGYYPDIPAVNEIIDEINPTNQMKFVPFPNITFLELYLQNRKYLRIGIEFHYNLKLEEVIDVSITSNQLRIWTNLLFPVNLGSTSPQWHQLESGFTEYYRTGFLCVQEQISIALLNRFSKFQTEALNTPKVSLKKFPRLEVTLAPPKPLVLSMGLIAAFSICFWRLLVTAVFYRVKMKEILHIVGLSNFWYWVGRMMETALLTFTIVTVSLILFKNQLFFANSNIWCIYLFIFVYVIHMSTFCFTLSTFYDSEKTAAFFGPVIFVLTYLPSFLYEITSNINFNYIWIIGGCFLPNTALGFGLKVLVHFETLANGFGWENMFDRVILDNNIAMAHILITIFGSCVLNIIITNYMLVIRAGLFTFGKKWHYFVTEYFSKRRQKVHVSSDSSKLKLGDAFNLALFYNEIRFRHVYIMYPNGLYGLTDANLTCINNQVNVILGGPGTGKTTILSAICNFLKPVSGHITIDDYNIRYHWSRFKDRVGFCPDTDFFFDELTPVEHLYLASRLKGMSYSDTNIDIEHFLNFFDITHIRDTPIKLVSPGEKRKLSLAAALCGRPKILLIDEPAKGMNIIDRRYIFNIIKGLRHNKCIVLTTKHRDIVDVCKGRIHFLLDGFLERVGTSYEVYKYFQIGYHIRMNKSKGCKPHKIVLSLQQQIRDIRKVLNDQEEMIIYVPDIYSRRIGAILKRLERKKVKYHVKNFRLYYVPFQNCSLRRLYYPDVFVGGEELPLKGSDVSDPIEYQHYEGHSFIFSQLRGYAIRYWNYFIGKHVWYLITMLAIIIFLPIAILILVYNEGIILLPPLNITLNTYIAPTTILSSYNTNSQLYLLIKRWYKESGWEAVDISDNKIDDYVLGLPKEAYNKIISEYIIGIEILSETSIVGYFNGDAYHSSPSALNMIYNAFAKKIGNKYLINVFNKPLPYTHLDQEEKYLLNSLGFYAAMAVTLCMTLTTIVIFETHHSDQAENIIFQTRLVVTQLYHWIYIAVCDFVFYTAAGAIITLLLIFVPLPANFSSANWGYIFIVLPFFAFGQLPVLHILVRYMKDTVIGSAYMKYTALATGVLLFLFAELVAYNSILDFIFYGLPHYTMSRYVYTLYKNIYTYNACNHLFYICPNRNIPCMENNYIYDKECCLSKLSYFAPGVYGFLAVIFINLFVGSTIIALTWFLEYKEFKKMLFKKPYQFEPKHVKRDGDPFLKQESFKINGLKPADRKLFKLIVANVTKYYGKQLIFLNLCITMDPYECLCIVGKPEVGKSTLLRVLAGLEPMTSGNIYMDGLDFNVNNNELRRHIGFIPLEENLCYVLTVVQTLEYHCRIRGVLKQLIPDAVRKTLIDLNIWIHKNTKVGQLSKGNIRKLRLAISCIGLPHIVYMEDPLRDTDPLTKKDMLNYLLRIRDTGTSIVIATRNIAEYELLVTKVAVLAQSRFRCTGSVNYLKKLYGKGRTIYLRLDLSFEHIPKNEICENIRDCLSKLFSEIIEIEERLDYMKFFVPGYDLPLSKMFGAVNSVMKYINVQFFTIQEMSLEELVIFKTRYEEDDLPTEESDHLINDPTNQLVCE